jgi:hypothetical protein
VTGLYGDGRDLATDGSSIYGSADGLIVGSRGGFVLEPVCSKTKPKPTTSRGMNLVLPAAALTQFSGAIPECGNIWLVVPGLVNAQPGDIIGVPAPPGSSTGNSVFVYFVPGAKVYNLVWQYGIRVLTRTSGPGINQITLTLSTRDLSSDLSDGAQLIDHGQGVGLGFYCVPLDLTVVVTQ